MKFQDCASTAYMQMMVASRSEVVVAARAASSSEQQRDDDERGSASFSFVASLAEQAARPHEQQHQQQRERDRDRVLRAEPERAEALDRRRARGRRSARPARCRGRRARRPRRPCRETATQLSGEIGIDDAEQRAGRARHQRADAEGDGIDALDVDAHQRRRLAVHADRDDGAADAGVAQQPVEQQVSSSASAMAATRSPGRKIGPISSARADERG